MSQNPLQRYQSVMRTAQPVIGMVHVHALPGTPGYQGAMQPILDAALKDAAVLKQAGVDAILLENMHDLPYLNREVGPEITSAITLIAYLVKKAFNLPTGLQILAGANRAALAAANSAGLDFIRAEGFVFGHVADEGWMDADAGPLLRYRRQIGADNILILTDIKKKHSAHSVTSDVTLVETAQAAEFFQSNGIIVTGSATGKAANIDDLQSLAGKVQLPVIVGSGVDRHNIQTYAPHCHGFIVGTSIKKDGLWQNPVDYDRTAALVEALKDK